MTKQSQFVITIFRVSNKTLLTLERISLGFVNWQTDCSFSRLHLKTGGTRESAPAALSASETQSPHG